MITMDILRTMRFVIGWPLWAAGGLGLLLILYRFPLPIYVYRLCAIILSLLIAINGIIQWTAIIFTSSNKIPYSWAVLYSVMVIVTGIVMIAMTIKLFINTWRE